MERITIDASGHHYEIYKETLEAGPSTKLRDICKNISNQYLKTVVILDRPYDAVAAILAMYQTDELHIPMSSCPVAFLKEMEFLELKPEMLAKCCRIRYV